MLGQVCDQLGELADDFRRQTSYRFFSASALVLYEGAARSAAETRVVVRLIDFAHAFPTALPQVSDSDGPDDNTLAGLTALREACEATAMEAVVATRI